MVKKKRSIFIEVLLNERGEIGSGDSSIMNNTVNNQGENGAINSGVKADDYFDKGVVDNNQQANKQNQQANQQQQQSNQQQQVDYGEQFKGLSGTLTEQGNQIKQLVDGFNGLINFMKEGQQQQQQGDNGNSGNDKGFSDQLLNNPDEAVNTIVGKVMESIKGDGDTSLVTKGDLTSQVETVANKMVRLNEIVQNTAKVLPQINDKDSEIHKFINSAIEKNPQVAKDPDLFQATVGLAVVNNLQGLLSNAKQSGLEEALSNPADFFMEGEGVSGSGADGAINPNNPAIQKYSKMFGINPTEYANEVARELKSQK